MEWISLFAYQHLSYLKCWHFNTEQKTKSNKRNKLLFLFDFKSWLSCCTEWIL